MSDLNQPNIEALDDESTEQPSPLIISSLHPVRTHVEPIELPQRWIPPAFDIFWWNSFTVIFTRKKKTRIRCVKKKCVQLLSMLNLHQSPTLSQLSRWGLKNETAIIVITGLRNNIVGKRRGEEKFWQLFLWEDLIKKNPTATGDRRRDSSKLKQPFLKCSFLHHSNCCSFTQI